MTTDAPGQSAQLFLRVVRVLDQHRVPYAAIGALAAAFFGVVRASLDADAVISLGQSRMTLDELLAALRGEGVSATIREGDESDPLVGVIAVEDTHHNRVDIILGIRGMDAAAFSRTLPALLLGIVDPNDRYRRLHRHEDLCGRAARYRRRAWRSEGVPRVGPYGPGQAIDGPLWATLPARRD